MRKAGLFLPMILLLLCVGCQKQQNMEAETLQQEYSRIAQARITAELTCQYETQQRCYTVCCEYRPEQTRLQVLEPQELCGIAATVTGNALVLSYDGLSLDAGELSSKEISPMRALPLLLQALQQGYVTSWGEETVGETACWRLSLDKGSGDGGEKVYYTLWLDKNTHALCGGEIRLGQRVGLQCRVTEFVWELTANDTGVTENLGGN